MSLISSTCCLSRVSRFLGRCSFIHSIFLGSSYFRYDVYPTNKLSRGVAQHCEQHQAQHSRHHPNFDHFRNLRLQNHHGPSSCRSGDSHRSQTRNEVLSGLKRSYGNKFPEAKIRYAIYNALYTVLYGMM